LKEYLTTSRLLLLALLIISCILVSCSRKPLVQLSPDALPEFTDDLDRTSLIEAVEDNLDYLQQQDPERLINFSGQPFPLSRLIQSLEFFRELLVDTPSNKELNRRVREDFDVYQSTGTSGFNPGRNMLVTGYFQPIFEGSLERKEPFLYPLYSIPPDLVRKKGAAGKQTVGRQDGTTFTPYWTRREIELQNEAAGSEIVWLKDPFDAFVLHVQGSGLIRLQDNTTRGVHFAGKNGHTYKSIGRFMVETGRITLEEASLKTIREYLINNPSERQEILHHNPSFIFFNWTDTHGAIGNLGKELTAGRSVAVDQSCFPKGALGFLFTRQPVIQQGQNTKWQPLHRFVLVQDTGSAIRGPGRIDLFWGTGPEAGQQAGQMKEAGNLYFFLLKESVVHHISGTMLHSPQ